MQHWANKHSQGHQQDHIWNAREPEDAVSDKRQDQQSANQAENEGGCHSLRFRWNSVLYNLRAQLQ